MAVAAGVNLAGWFASRWQRLNGDARVRGVDLARGLAVVGMFAAHMFALPEFDPTEASTWGAVASGRSSILFATLAGVSLALITGGRRALDPEALNRARGRILIRAVVVWMIGVALIATGVPVYVILPAYAVLFVVSVPFLGLTAAPLLATAAGLAVVMPFVQVLLDALPVWASPTGQQLSLLVGWHYPFPVWIAFVLCGLGVGRLDLRSWRVQAGLVVAGAIAAAIGYGLDAGTGADEASESAGLWGAVWTARPHSSGLLEVIGSGGFAVAAIGVCLLVCRTALVWVVLPIRATGAMPLTAYTAQLAGWAFVATAVLGDPGDLAGFRALDPFAPFTVWIIVGCTAWALLVGRGPLEWLVDRASRLIDAPSTTRTAR